MTEAQIIDLEPLASALRAMRSAPLPTKTVRLSPAPIKGF
jgi:hypothetical protein